MSYTIIRLSPLIHEGEEQYKPYIVGDPRMVSLSVTPPLKNPGYAPVSVNPVPVETTCMTKKGAKLVSVDNLLLP